jgi:RND family efflux transporter MFP subunit
MKRKRIVLVSAALVIAAAALVSVAAGARPQAVAAVETPQAPAVTAAPVTAVKSAPREEITGALQPAKELKLGFEVAGRLARVLVQKGAPVKEGQVIAQLDPEVADAQVQQAAAAVNAAEAQSALAADTAQRQAQLRETGSVSEYQGKSSQTQARGASAQLDAARAQLAQARAARRRHDLRAPFAGVLIDAPDQVGATVAAGTALFTLEQLDPLVLKLTVSEAARPLLKTGSRLPVKAVSGDANAEDAWVRAVIPSADPATRRVPVEVVVPNGDGRFTAHTLARAVLPLGSPQDAQVAPSTALLSQGGDHVYALLGSEVRRIPVKVIERGAQQVVFQAPQPIEKVVDYPAPGLQDGAKVTVK